MYAPICKHCGDRVTPIIGSDGQIVGWEHYTRYYRPSPFPARSVKCYADFNGHYCGCEKPEAGEEARF